MIDKMIKELSILDFRDVEGYIYFCLENSETKKKFLTEEHHILPSKVFLKYSNLTENKWNSVHLSHENHYIAHSILHNSCDNISFASAWGAMNYMNVENGRITNPENILGKELYSKLREKRNREISNHKNSEIILEDGSISTIGKEAGKKISAKRLQIDIKTGKTMASIHNTKSAESRKKRYLDEKGNITSISLRASKKAETTMNEVIILNDGSESTIRKELTKKKAITDLNKSRRFRLLNIYNKSEDVLLRKELMDLHQGLLKSSKDNFLGKHHRSKSNLIKRGLEYLQGTYVEEIF